MIGQGPHYGFRVPPRSVDIIRQVAANVSHLFGTTGQVSELDMSAFLDSLAQYGITYDILEAHEMPHAGVEACCIPEDLDICFRNDVYENACRNEPRARFTVMHEFGHLILGHRRTVNRESANIELKTFEDSEWQANQFAAEFLMPYETIAHLKLSSAEDIQNHFNVSLPAAHRRVNQLVKRNEL